MGFLDDVGDFIDASPVGFLINEFRRGQARDEARTVRAEDIARENEVLERQSISGRIAEGAKHGISKLAALGAAPGGFSSPVGQDTAYLNDAGGQSYGNSSSKLQRELLQAQIDGVKLDNLSKSQDIASRKEAGRPGHSTRAVEVVPSKVPASTAANSGVQAGAPPTVQHFKEPDQGLSVQMSEPFKQASEDSLMPEMEYYFQNRILKAGDPMGPAYPDLKEHPPKPGHIWVWFPEKQRYYQVPGSSIGSIKGDHFGPPYRKFPKFKNFGKRKVPGSYLNWHDIRLDK